MKRAAMLVFLIAAASAAIWWLAVKRPAEILAARQADEAAAAAVVQAQREAMFGPESLHPDVAWRQTGLGYRIIEEGRDPKPYPGARVSLNYVGRMKDGTVFDRSKGPTEFRIGGMIPGMSAGAQMLGARGRGVFFIPPQLGYGGRQVAGIPPSSGLIFEIEMVAVNP